MTKEEALKLYLDTYKASTKQAADYKLPEGFVQGPTKYDMRPAPAKPLPKPDYNKGFIKSPKQEFNRGSRVEGEGDSLYFERLWEDPNRETFPTNHNDWTIREYRQNRAMDTMNRYLSNKVEPLVENSYTKPWTTPKLNMSREAMIRRINALKSQQARDARLRAATSIE